MDILPGLGIDLIKFGLTEEQVIRVLGYPSKTYFTDSGCKRLQFNDLKIELSFEPDNENLFGWLEIYCPNARLFNNQLIGKEIEYVVSLLKAKFNEEPKIDDYGSFLSVTFENHWIELQFEFGLLKNINLGVLYNEADEPQWPNSL